MTARPERATPRKTGPKGLRTRQLIKDTVHDLMTERDVSELKLSDICESSGLTVGAFYFHFENKDAAIAEVALDALTRYYTRIANFPVSRNFLLDCYELSARHVWRQDHPRVLHGVFRTLRTNPDVYPQWRPLRTVAMERALERAAAARKEFDMALDGLELTVEVLLQGIEGTYEMLFYRGPYFPNVEALSADPKTFTLDLALVWYRGVLGRDPEPWMVAEVEAASTPVGRYARR